MTHLTEEQINAILAQQDEPDLPDTSWLEPDLRLNPMPEPEGWELVYADLL